MKDLKTKRLNQIFTNAWGKKRWWNEGEFCNTKTHPSLFHYRRYRRGKNRCSYCGAKLGKVKCVMQATKERVVDNLSSGNSLFQLLRRKGMIKPSL